jgi:Secretion system C-terminal sorting domain
LQAIAQQDPKQGGPAVNAALVMLQDCVKPETPHEYRIVSDPEGLKYAQVMQERNASPLFREASSISVSPNPTNASFSIRNPNGSSGTLTVLDISGRAWLQQKFSGQEVRVDFKAGTPSGVYLLRFDMEDGTSLFKKLIVQFN